MIGERRVGAVDRPADQAVRPRAGVEIALRRPQHPPPVAHREQRHQRHAVAAAPPADGAVREARDDHSAVSGDVDGAHFAGISNLPADRAVRVDPHQPVAGAENRIASIRQIRDRPGDLAGVEIERPTVEPGPGRILPDRGIAERDARSRLHEIGGRAGVGSDDEPPVDLEPGRFPAPGVHPADSPAVAADPQVRRSAQVRDRGRHGDRPCRAADEAPGPVGARIGEPAIGQRDEIEDRVDRDVVARRLAPGRRVVQVDRVPAIGGIAGTADGDGLAVGRPGDGELSALGELLFGQRDDRAAGDRIDDHRRLAGAAKADREPGAIGREGDADRFLVGRPERGDGRNRPLLRRQHRDLAVQRTGGDAAVACDRQAIGRAGKRLLMDHRAVAIECTQRMIAGVHGDQQAPVGGPGELLDVTAPRVEGAHELTGLQREEQDPVFAGAYAGRAADRDQIVGRVDRRAVQPAQFPAAHRRSQHMAQIAALQIPDPGGLVVRCGHDETAGWIHVQPSDEGRMRAGLDPELRPGALRAGGHGADGGPCLSRGGGLSRPRCLAAAEDRDGGQQQDDPGSRRCDQRVAGPASRRGRSVNRFEHVRPLGDDDVDRKSQRAGV